MTTIDGDVSEPTVPTQDISRQGSSTESAQTCQGRGGWTGLSLTQRLSALNEAHSSWVVATESSKAWSKTFEELGMTRNLSSTVLCRILSYEAQYNLHLVNNEARVRVTKLNDGEIEEMATKPFAMWVNKILVDTVNAFESLGNTKKLCRATDRVQIQASQSNEPTGEEDMSSLRESHLWYASPTATAFFLADEIHDLAPILAEVVPQHPDVSFSKWTDFSNSLTQLRTQWRPPNELSHSQQQQIYWNSTQEEEAWARRTANKVKRDGLQWLSIIPSDVWPQVKKILTTHYEREIRQSARKKERRAARGGAPEATTTTAAASASASPSATPSLRLDLKLVTKDISSATSESREEATETPLGSVSSSPTFIGSATSITAVSESPTVAVMTAVLVPETVNSTIPGRGTGAAVTKTREEETPVAHDPSGSFFSQDWSDPSRALFTVPNRNKAIEELKLTVPTFYYPSISTENPVDESSFTENFERALGPVTRLYTAASERNPRNVEELKIRNQMRWFGETLATKHKDRMDKFSSTHQTEIQTKSRAFQNLVKETVCLDRLKLVDIYERHNDSLFEWTKDEQSLVTDKHQTAKAELRCQRTRTMSALEFWQNSLSRRTGSYTAQREKDLLSKWNQEMQRHQV